MAKISKTKEYAVKYLSNTMKMSPDIISKELNISLVDVQNILNTEVEPETTNNKKDKVSKSHQMMIRHTRDKKTNNVSIMTEGASQFNDAMRDKIHAKASRSSKDAIFRPRND